MAIDAHDNLIVGTDPGGLVMRVSPAGEGFVLYQMAKKEVTAVAVGKDGSIYAAAVGVKPQGHLSRHRRVQRAAAGRRPRHGEGGGTTLTVRARRRRLPRP